MGLVGRTAGARSPKTTAFEVAVYSILLQDRGAWREIRTLRIALLRRECLPLHHPGLVPAVGLEPTKHEILSPVGLLCLTLA